MAEDKRLAKEAETVAPVPARTSSAFRDRLLAELPTLGVPSWDAKEAFEVSDVMAGLGRLVADTLLEPLARVARHRGE